MRQRIHFLSGLPRTGSTLLGSILNQNPDVYVSPTSPLYSLLVNANEHINYLSLQHTFDAATIGSRIYRSIVNAVYPDDRSFPIVFDKHRGWPKNVDAIRDFVDVDPRIVCTVRPIAEIITSYIVLAEKDPDNFIDCHLRRDGIDVTNEARAMLLWANYLRVPYENMTIGLKMHRESILLVEYDDLVYYPDKTLRSVYEFCGIELFDHDFSDVANTCSEAKDEAWGMHGLHDIRPVVKKQSVDPVSVLPFAAIEYFIQFDLTEAMR